MFIWNFVLGVVMDEILDWIYGSIVGFLGNFFSSMGNMGAELFDMPWVQSVVLFFSYLGWALFVTGLVVAGFETAIEYQNGRGNLKDLGLNSIKAFLSVNLFTIVPVELYRLAVTLQSSLATGISGVSGDIGTIAGDFMSALESGDIGSIASSGIFGGLRAISSPIFALFLVIMMGYAVVKVFFSCLKRGGILLIQIAVGSLYMFSIPRGYIDGFVQWIKQIIGLCLTTFLQATILVAGLMALRDNALLGLGLMLSAGEVPRVAGAFGLDTSTRANIMSAVYTAQAAVNTTRTVVQAVAK